jgi:hypothetical protein
MEHHFVFPKVQEITDGRRPAASAPGARSQRDLVLASLLRRP